MVTAKDAKGLKYKMSEEFTVEAFETFVTALKAGELEPFLKSGMWNIVLSQCFGSSLTDPDTDPNSIISLNRTGCRKFLSEKNVFFLLIP